MDWESFGYFWGHYDVRHFERVSVELEHGIFDEEPYWRFRWLGLGTGHCERRL